MRRNFFIGISVLSALAGVTTISWNVYQWMSDGLWSWNWVGLGFFAFLFPYALRWFLYETG